MDFYKALFNMESSEVINLDTKISYPAIDEETIGKLDTNLSCAEIKKAMFAKGSFKSPGIDGYPALFFKKNWSYVCLWVGGGHFVIIFRGCGGNII